MSLSSRWIFIYLLCLVFVIGLISRFLMIEKKLTFHFPPWISKLESDSSITQPPAMTTSWHDSEEVKMLKELIAWPEPRGTPSVESSTSPENCDYQILNPRAHYSVGETLELLLTARDHQKRPKSYGGDFFQAKLHSPGLKAGVTGSVRDHQNGTYTITFLLLWPGDVEVSIRLMLSSEAVHIIKRLRESRPDKASFSGVFMKNGKEEVTECNVYKLNGSLCEYADLGTKEKWYCIKPKELPCSSCVYHVNGNVRSITTKEDEAFLHKRLTGQVIPSRIPSLHVLARTNSHSELRLPNCTPGLPIPNPSGFYYDDDWTSLICSSRKFPMPSNITKCLSGKAVYMFGDSTLKQWWEYLESFVPSLKKIGFHLSPYMGLQLAIDTENNYLIQWRAHGRPLSMGKLMVANLHYITNDIDGIGGGPGIVIVFNIWAHLVFFSVDLYIQRMQKIHRAVIDLLQRSPQTTIIIKTANTGKTNMPNSEWLSFQLDSILRRVFLGQPVAIIDAWQMTSCHYLPYNIHPGRVIIRNEVDMFLSYICPQ
ncbi:NXPE family member 3-like isoform X1 [Rhinatrema bivittatum]|uniref:NXPE family member 3-like isoform X1 n=1 Tax=Rhinatrema bivittatum TaxID=194408 RepID=UPI001129F322|nr:NXPE family member 3-like isoform X1 [Rhinatrema bivittatum]